MTTTDDIERVKWEKDHRRMCAAFDDWVVDESTHWLSDHDAAYQGFMAAWEMRSEEMLKLGETDFRSSPKPGEKT